MVSEARRPIRRFGARFRARKIGRMITRMSNFATRRGRGRIGFGC